MRKIVTRDHVFKVDLLRFFEPYTKLILCETEDLNLMNVSRTKIFESFYWIKWTKKTLEGLINGFEEFSEKYAYLISETEYNRELFALKYSNPKLRPSENGHKGFNLDPATSDRSGSKTLGKFLLLRSGKPTLGLEIPNFLIFFPSVQKKSGQKIPV